MSEQNLGNEYEIRKQKVTKIKEMGNLPYMERYETNKKISEVAALEDGTENISVAGRIVSLRNMGKLIFAHLFDWEGKIQFALQKKQLHEKFDEFVQLVDTGDFLGISGTVITTKTGEKTIDVKDWLLLSKTLRPLPEKYHGLVDRELVYRRRYLDLITNKESCDRFKSRLKIINLLRDFLNSHDFLEIDTPVLINKASGALATPFKTHHNALDIDIYMRIAPETYLKRAIAGGFNRVFEFARCFRNEGLDPSHLPDFTLLEYYTAYWNYEDNMRFTKQLVNHVLMGLSNSLEITYNDQKIDFSGEWPVLTFAELIVRDCGIDITKCADKAALVAIIKEKKIELERDIDDSSVSYGTLLDLLYKKVSRPKIIQPAFLIGHPLDISPLARTNDQNNMITDRYQLIVNSWEIVNAYSELVDPIEQRKRFEKQMEARKKGDLETMDVDEDFIQCMEYGMPPMSGWGMGIDRFVALLTNAQNLRDVVLFPLMRSE